jgi:hypothetical protein
MIISYEILNDSYFTNFHDVTNEQVSAVEAWQLCREKEMWLLTLETHEELKDLKLRIQSKKILFT